MFMTRNKLLLRSFFSSAKRAIMNKFPMKIKKASNKRAQHFAIVSAREGKSITIDSEVLIELIALDVFFILVFNQKENEVLHDWVEIRDIMLRE